MSFKETIQTLYRSKFTPSEQHLYKKRLQFELIETEVQELEDYFLNLKKEGYYDIKNEYNLMIPWLLGISNEFDINKESSLKYGEFPDIDIDYLPAIRGVLKEVWAPKEFGPDKVCNIGTYGTYGLKSSFLDMVRVHNLDRNEILALTKHIKDKDEDSHEIDYDRAMELYPDLKRYCDEHPDVAKAVQKIVGKIRNFGKHAAGLIISNQPLADFIPLAKNAKDDVLSSAWEEGLARQDLSPVGLIKMDLLVVKSLQQIAWAVKFIKERHSLKSLAAMPDQWDWSDLSYLDDPKSIELANKGELKCIFQFDSPGIRKMVEDGGVSGFKDLAAYTALYRPGPMGKLMHKAYINRKRGTEQYDIHPKLEPYLKDTYGVMVFQETIMFILNVVGDIPLRSCYDVIKAISKKKIKVFTKYKERFLERGKINLGYTDEQINEFWLQIESFAGYGFNKCLSGNMFLQNKVTNDFKTISEMQGNLDEVKLDSYVDGKIVEDDLLDIFETGEKEVFEFTLSNGMIVECTMDHKFLCTDDKMHTMEEILAGNLEIKNFENCS